MTNTASPLTAEINLARWTWTITGAILREMLDFANRPDVLSFALGLPAAEFFPAEDYGRAAAQVLAADPKALQYGPPFQPLKTHVVGLMAQRGVKCTEEQIFLTAGAQQGVSLLVRLLLDEGGELLCEELTYPGFRQIVEPFQPKVLSVPTDLETGMDVEAVEALLASHSKPAFIYTITDGHNPLGLSMSVESRARLVQLAEQYNVPIIEDDPYGLLYYDAPPPPPLRALSSQRVFYVGSFSKVLAPGVRVGWVVVPEELVSILSVLKEATDLDTSNFNQRAVFAYLNSGCLPAHLEALRREYGVRREAMLNALSKHMPEGARWSQPSCGVFVWVVLPEGIDAGLVLKAAIEREKVTFLPGHAFDIHYRRSAAHCMRLNFSNCPPHLIEDGVARLGKLIKTFV